MVEQYEPGESWYYDFFDGDDDEDDDPPDERDENQIGCWFPDECLMPGEHMKSECHTAEMVEAANAESLTGDTSRG
jgi:hypothetical protein